LVFIDHQLGVVFEQGIQPTSNDVFNMDAIIVDPKDLVYQPVRTTNDFDSFGNFEVQLWRILDHVLFAMLLDEMNVIIVIQKIRCIKLSELVRKILIQRAISNYINAGFSTPCYLPCI
jgi:hypothetical protein